MGELKEIGRLQIDTDERIMRRDWRMERVGWWAILALLVVGLLGGFGHGPLAHATAGGDGEPTRIEYERIARHGSPTALALHVGPALLAADTVRVWLSRDWVEGVDIEDVIPTPERVLSTEDRVTWVFAVSRRDRPAELLFRVRPDLLWRRTGEVGVEGGPTRRFAQVVLP